MPDLTGKQGMEEKEQSAMPHASAQPDVHAEAEKQQGVNPKDAEMAKAKMKAKKAKMADADDPSEAEDPSSIAARVEALETGLKEYGGKLAAIMDLLDGLKEEHGDAPGAEPIDVSDHAELVSKDEPEVEEKGEMATYGRKLNDIESKIASQNGDIAEIKGYLAQFSKGMKKTLSVSAPRKLSEQEHYSNMANSALKEIGVTI